MLTNLYLSEACVLTLLLKDKPTCLSVTRLCKQRKSFRKRFLLKIGNNNRSNIASNTKRCPRVFEMHTKWCSKVEKVLKRCHAQRGKAYFDYKNYSIHNSLLNNSIVDCVEKHKTDRSGTSNTKRWIFCISYPVLPPWKLRRREGIQG